jgi:hypothetical protein
MRTTRFSRLYMRLTEAIDKTIGWANLPLPGQLATLAGIRMRMREKNLYDTGTAPSNGQPVPGPSDDRRLVARTADGSYNDLDQPAMGMAGSRFGRNVPIDLTYPESEPAMLTPNPRTVSLELLTRREFQPATTLNVLAAAWLQFMIRDWFSHGKNQTENPWKIPLAKDDPWPEHPMTILRTDLDPTRPPGNDGFPPTFANTETHWWDGSQLYGSDPNFQKFVRSGTDGKLVIDPDGLIALHPDAPVQPSNVAGWWLGLAVLQTLFTLEHNAICDHLKATYPAWSDDDLFDHARLVTSALLAKIHTVEWTPAILGHPALQIAMRANWWGLQNERLWNLFGRFSQNEVISGIPGSPKDHFGVPYSLTEEFVAVYRMHPLIPDDWSLRSASNNASLADKSFPDLTGAHAMEVLTQYGMRDLLYSFGTINPGAIVLHNYPRHMQHFLRPDGFLQDLAATDILRTRERGVPRYNAFRTLMHRPPVTRFEDLTENRDWAEEIRRVYDNDIDRVDLVVGLYGEPRPKGFGFSDTAFRVFTVMASRRLNSDRFFTTDFTPQVYSEAGMAWLQQNSMLTVLQRHYPALLPALRGVTNAFAPWNRTTP